MLSDNAIHTDITYYYQGVPDYMIEIYDWAYVNPKWVRFLDNNLVVRILLFGNDQRLIQAYLQEIKPSSRVWQVAHVYGDLVWRAADKVGTNGTFHLTDVTPIQVEHGIHKLKHRPWAHVFQHDAATFKGDGNYELICSFFLLHEVPDEKKRQIVNHMLSKLPKTGKLIFVDYHKPAWWQPVRYILKVVNFWLEPFADSIWKHELSEFANHPENYTWHKRTIFGGVYQIVIVQHQS